MAPVTRRSAIRTLSALPAIAAVPAAGVFSALPRTARAAEFSYKYGNNLPLSHPLNIRAQEAADRIAKETNGRVEIKIFPTTSSAATPTCWPRCARAASSSSRPRRW